MHFNRRKHLEKTSISGYAREKRVQRMASRMGMGVREFKSKHPALVEKLLYTNEKIDLKSYLPELKEPQKVFYENLEEEVKQLAIIECRSTAEIKTRLNISEAMFYRLLKK